MPMERLLDIIIIGSGPAGLAAAVYAQRAKLDTIVIEKEMMSGGQVLTTYEVDNYPGLQGLGGFDLGMKFREHADELGAVFVEDTITGIEQDGDCKVVVGVKERYRTKTVIIASGATHRKLEVPGETEFTGMGVSYCATCDGAFFRDKVTAVVGGGDVALEDAIFLARMCKKVYLIHRRDELRGARSLQEKLKSLDNVEFIWNTVVDAIEGESKVNRLKLSRTDGGDPATLAVDGVFVAVGITPNSQPYEGLVEMERGYIKADEDTETSVPGIFAAGDVRTKQLRQIVTAVADGANAVTSAERYLTKA